LKFVANHQFYKYFKDLKKTFAYDFVFNKKVIEYNGDYWHCNPKIYDKNFFNKNKKMSSEEIWEYDKIKIDSIVKEGYEVLVIWESDYKENKELAIQKCINFINS